MAIIGLGTDIVEIARFKPSQLNKLANRILTDSELAEFAAHKQPQRFLAKRWAAKEAAAKAVGTGIAQGVTFQDFCISNLTSGAPVLKISGTAEKMIGLPFKAHLSLSDEQTYAVATVIIERL
ncbi:holo-ACP synthase [Catenovulum sp. 2E275]|uniref:holo-ACP synthase n=1 Tax=Catenovulum sp. 2E275 TaxID=2980497 RepID=UPI0021D0DF8C|nr:holo-ACP synthase [Catenovulum sp. 2E275]MCU4675948.1 holo-ACP synthase [Catenovulum sp. 2E275]